MIVHIVVLNPDLQSSYTFYWCSFYRFPSKKRKIVFFLHLPCDIAYCSPESRSTIFLSFVFPVEGSKINIFKVSYIYTKSTWKNVFKARTENVRRNSNMQGQKNISWNDWIFQLLSGLISYERAFLLSIPYITAYVYFIYLSACFMFA